MWAVSGVGMVASACATGRDSIKEPQSMTNQRVMSSDTVPVTQAELLPCPLPWCGAEAQLVGPYLCTATFTVNCTIHGDAVQTPHKRNPEDAIAAWNTRTTPAPAMPSREEIAALVERLRKRAQSESEARRMMMEAKSLRQPDNPEGRTDLYHWPKPEETDAWKAAQLLAALTSVDRASEADKLREAVIRQCAEVANATYRTYVEPTQWDYGAQDACTKIERAILALSSIGSEAE
jgi:hypothetical protein